MTGLVGGALLDARIGGYVGLHPTYLMPSIHSRGWNVHQPTRVPTIIIFDDFFFVHSLNRITKDVVFPYVTPNSMYCSYVRVLYDFGVCVCVRTSYTPRWGSSFVYTRNRWHDTIIFFTVLHNPPTSRTILFVFPENIWYWILKNWFQLIRLKNSIFKH